MIHTGEVLKAKKDSDSDINSESDSGVGSVRTGTENHSDSAIDSGKEPSLKQAKPTKPKNPMPTKGNYC